MCIGQSYLFTLEMLVLEHVLFQSKIALLCCRKWNVLYQIGFWTGLDRVQTLSLWQNLQQNFLLVNGELPVNRQL